MGILDNFKSFFKSNDPAPEASAAKEESLPEKESPSIDLPVNNNKQENLDALIFALQRFMQSQDETEEPEEKKKFNKLSDFLRNN